MKTITLTKGKSCIVDDDDYDELMKYKWKFRIKDGYAARNIQTKEKNTTRFMHRQIIGAPPDLQTDHVNHNTLDNRKENLRVCTRSQNNHNHGLSRNNTSGYKGVSWKSNRGKWYASIGINGVGIYLGMFTNKDDAARAYNEAATRLHGEFALLNKLGGV